ncbi:MAG: hypothetical protein ACFFEV_01115 [Candidatus Thorarchaeota archaeon]
MILKFNTITLLAGLLLGVGASLIVAFITDPLLEIIRADAPDNAILNSEGFTLFMKYGLPVIITIFSILVIGPFFGGINEFFMNHETILGQSPRVMYILSVLIFTLLVEFLIIVTGTPFQIEKIVGTAWMFIVLGLMIGLA